MIKKKIKVLIVEDSLVVQELIKHIIESDSMLEVIGLAKDGIEALEIISNNKPDVITMDIFMPRMDGFEATKRIMATHPIPILIISAKFKKGDVEFSFKALECGALAIMEKPSGLMDPNFSDLSSNIIETLKSISEIRLITRRFPPKPSGVIEAKSTPPFPPIKVKDIKAIAIGASIGGPMALKEILSNISSDCPVPIFIVQHIMEGFVEDFAHWIAEFSKLPIIVPGNNESIKPGHVYIAPDGFHMIIKKDRTISLSSERSNRMNKPSVAKLFESATNIYHEHVIGIILTGMGDDGSEELLKMKDKGALTIAQDHNSSLVFGMPGRAIEIGAARHILPIDQIAPFLNECLRAPFPSNPL